MYLVHLTGSSCKLAAAQAEIKNIIFNFKSNALNYALTTDEIYQPVKQFFYIF